MTIISNLKFHIILIKTSQIDYNIIVLLHVKRIKDSNIINTS